MPEDVTPATFHPHVGSAFTAHFDGADPVELTLVGVRLDPASPGQPRAEPFTLRFESGPSPALAQGTYVLQHDVLGELAVFIVPSAAGAYEAVFN
ncbi:MAG TPA: hypothetical protein VF230_08175 [Acidimicrobiales bacterium]